MPQIAPPIQTTEDLGSLVSPVLQSAKRAVEAKAAREILAGLGIGEGASSDVSLTSSLGQAVGAFAKGMTDLSQAQQMLLQQTLQNLQQPGKTGSDLGSVLSAMLILQMIERMGEKKEQKTDDATVKILDKFLDHLQSELEEERQRGPSTIDRHVHQIAESLVTQRILEQNDPLSYARRLKELRELLADLGGGESNRITPEYLQLKEIEERRHARELEHLEKVRQHESSRQIWQEAVPKALEGLARVLSGFGLVPVPQGTSVPEELVREEAAQLGQ